VEALIDELDRELVELRSVASKAACYTIPRKDAAEKRRADISCVATAIAADFFWPWLLRSTQIKEYVKAELRRDTIEVLASHQKRTCGNWCSKFWCGDERSNKDLLVEMYKAKAEKVSV
jgi:hypothetical protein